MLMKWTYLKALLAFLFVGVTGVLLQAQPAADTVTNTYKEEVVVERTTTTRETQTTVRKAKEHYKCAIFVANRAERVDDRKVLAMQDLLTGYLTDKGFIVIAREDVANAVAGLNSSGPNRGNDNLPGAQLDQILSNNTSALRLTQNLDADYVLMVTITTFGTDTQTYSGQGMNLKLIKNQMRASYRLLDGTTGGSTTAGVATATIEDRTDGRSQVSRQNVVDDLIDATAMDMARMLGQAASNARIAPPAMTGGEVPFTINCGVADLVFPEIVRNERNERVVMAGRYRLEAMAVVVELDGVAIGTTPGPFKAKPGLHKMRLRREGFSDWEANVSIREGTVLDIAMKMSPEGYRRFQDMTTFVESLKQSAILTEAQAAQMASYAKMLDQSGIRYDIRGQVNDVRLPPTTLPLP